LAIKIVDRGGKGLKSVSGPAVDDHCEPTTPFGDFVKRNRTSNQLRRQVINDREIQILEDFGCGGATCA
jgi:hypothetical protein